MNWFNSNLFLYGEIGNRLDGARSSENYVLSANKLTNFYVSDLGILTVAKQYEQALDLAEEIYHVIPTGFGFRVFVGTTNFISVDNSNTVVATSPHNLTIGVETRVTMFAENQLHVQPNHYFIVNTDGTVSPSTFIDTIRLPVSSRKSVIFDLYKVYDVAGTLEPRLLGTYQDTELVITSDGVARIAGTDAVIDRWYKTYRAYLDLNDLTSPTAGLTFCVFRDYHIDPDLTTSSTYIIHNTPTELIDYIDDPTTKHLDYLRY
jgi:hypothetical protein